MAKESPKGSMKATIIVSMSNYLEASSIVAGAGGLSLWIDYLHLNPVEVGILGAVSANGFGSAAGALVGGFLVDRFGRKLVYKNDLLIYMLGVILVALSVNFLMLLTGYFITGIAVGAGIPAAWTYIAEEAPTQKRAARVGWGQFAWCVGPAVALLLSVAVAPLGLLGNRLIFGSLFVMAFITWILQQQISESHVWEEQKMKHEKVTISELITVRANRKAFFLLVSIYFFWGLVAGTMGYFMPYIYQIVGGLSSIKANLLQASLWVLTVLSTYLVFIRYGDKLNRKYLFSVGALMEIAAWCILSFGRASSWLELLLFVVLWGVAAGFSAQVFYSLWAIELFKTQYRAFAQGLIVFLIRMGVGSISLVVPTLILKIGFKLSGSMMIGFLIIHWIIGFLLAPETRGKTLDEIEMTWYGTNKEHNPTSTTPLAIDKVDETISPSPV